MDSTEKRGIIRDARDKFSIRTKVFFVNRLFI